MTNLEGKPTQTQIKTGTELHLLDTKERYSEVGKNYRFYLNWRHFLFAGFFVIQGFVIKDTIELIADNNAFSILLPLLSGLLSLAFLGFDERIQEIYFKIIETGSELEGDQLGFYSKISARSEKISHSTILKYVYVISAVLLFLFGILIACRYFCMLSFHSRF